jgi:predicted GNAT family acetyltransferase
MEAVMLRLRTYASAAEFLTVTEPSLRREEAINNVIYGIALAQAAHPDRITTPPFLATVHAGSVLAYAALMTPPWRLLLYAETPAPPFALLIEQLRHGGWSVPGVTARSPLAEQFAAAWGAATGAQCTIDVRMRVFELRTVIWPPLPRGHLRLATVDDLKLVHRWYCEFSKEAVHNDPLPTMEGMRRVVEDRSVYLWEDGEPVSLAARGRRLPHGASVGPVYTPPEKRGRGYASACVAALSQAILDAGAHYCTLFTDLANPTSNHIYQRIGYRALCDFDEYSFRAS